MNEPNGQLTNSRQTAILLIAHGSRRAEANQELVDLSARLLNSNFSESQRYTIIEPSYLELADPDIITGGGLCVAKGATRVLMIPYFLSAGVHIRRDLTEARDQLSERFPSVSFLLGPPLGPHHLLDDLVCRRVKDLDAS